MSYTQLISQEIGIAADGIHSASQATTGQLTGAVDLSKWREVMFIVDTGVFGASGTVNFVISGATTSGASYTSISSTSISQLTTSQSNSYVIVSTTNEKVQALGLGYKWLKGALTVGTAAGQVSVHVIGTNTPYEPASDNNATTVFQKLEVFR